VDEVYEYFKKHYKTRLVINENRANWPYLAKKVKDREKRLPAQLIVEKWRQENALYSTPTGLNDDHFWMYGAIRSANEYLKHNSNPEDGSRVYLVSNDLLRDHRFRLAHDVRFFRFIQAHTIRFRLGDEIEDMEKGRPPSPGSLEQLTFFYPFRYSINPTKDEKTGAWMFPYIPDDDLLHVKDLYKNVETRIPDTDDDYLPPLPADVANRVRWMLCEPPDDVESLFYPPSE